MNKRKSTKAKEQLNVTFHHEKDFTGLSSNKIMSPTQVPRSVWLTASCTFIRQCDTKPRGLLSDRVSSRKLSVLIPLFMSGTEKKFWSDGILQECHLHPLGAGWTWDMGRFVRGLCRLLPAGPGALPCTTHCPALPCPAKLSAGQENPREMVGWFTGWLCFYSVFISLKNAGPLKEILPFVLCLQDHVVKCLTEPLQTLHPGKRVSGTNPPTFSEA